MSNSWSDTSKAVADRAKGRCEYCRMHQALQGATFHIEHILPSFRGGASGVENLAWCCPFCNLRKSNRIEAIDPDSGTPVPLFNPRVHRWPDHFSWVGFQIRGESAVGRATINLLQLNSPRRRLIRTAEERFGFFPPSE